MTKSQTIHREAVVVDCHNDIAETLLLKEIGPRATFRDRWIPELREGGVDVQVCPIYTPPQVPEAQLRMTMQLLAALKKEERSNVEEVAICTDGAQIDSTLAQGKIALIIALEGAMALAADPTLLELFYELGVRMVSFTHLGRTLLADGSAEDATGSRLTQAGVEVFFEMERLGILFDVSHLGITGLDHVLTLATRPLIASHSAARAIFDHHRNLSDRQLRAIAGTGGVVGVSMTAMFIDPARPTIDRVVDHFEHIAEVAGIEHVGVGADFVSELYKDLYPDHADLTIEGLNPRQAIDGLYAPRHMPHLTEALLNRGFSEQQVRLILGENFLRVFRQMLGVPKTVSVK